MTQDMDELKLRVESLEQNLAALSDMVVKLESVLDEIAQCILPEETNKQHETDR